MEIIANFEEENRDKNAIICDCQKRTQPNNGAASKAKKSGAFLSRSEAGRLDSEKHLKNYFKKITQNTFSISQFSNNHANANSVGFNGEKLFPVFFSTLITDDVMETLLREGARKKQSPAQILHKRYSDNLKNATGRRVDFHIVFGTKAHKKSSPDALERSNSKLHYHTHGQILLTEKELDGRTAINERLRNALRNQNKKTKQTKSFKYQEVFLQSKAEAETYATQYTQAQQIELLSQYFLKNAKEARTTFERNPFTGEHYDQEKWHACSKFIGGFNKQVANSRAKDLLRAKAIKDYSSPKKVQEREAQAQREANLRAINEIRKTAEALSKNSNLPLDDALTIAKTNSGLTFSSPHEERMTELNWKIKRANALENKWGYSPQEAFQIAEREYQKIMKPTPATQIKRGSW